MLYVGSISQDLKMPAMWRLTKFQTNVLASRGSVVLCHFHWMLWVIMGILFSFCLFYQLLRRAQMVWRCQTTTVIFVWEIPTWTRKLANQKTSCPAQTVAVLVKQPHILSLACLLRIFLDQIIIIILCSQVTPRVCSSLQWWWLLWKPIAGSALNASAVICVEHQKMMWVCLPLSSHKNVSTVFYLHREDNYCVKRFLPSVYYASLFGFSVK